MSALLQYFPFLECVCIQDDDHDKASMHRMDESHMDESGQDNSAHTTGRSTRGASRHGGRKGAGRKAKDSLLMSTKPRGSVDDSSSAAIAAEKEAARVKKLLREWKWPEGFVIPPAVLDDPRKMKLIKKVQSDIDKHIKRTRKDFHGMAATGNFQLDNRMILRYLEGAQWVEPMPAPMNSCADRLISTVMWRVSVPTPVRDRALMAKELCTGKFIVRGISKNGRPIMYVRAGRENTWDPKGNTISLIYTMERAVASMDVNTCETVCIVDCEGVGIMNAPSTAFVTSAIEIMGHHYPRRNGQIFICNVSSVFYMIWNVISISLPEEAKRKIRILTSDRNEMRLQICELVDPSQLMKDFGGDDERPFDCEEYLDSDPNMRT